jgi:rhodanese-related sulfurtransferase
VVEPSGDILRTVIPGRQEIVAYCRGPYCMLAVEAVKLLRRRGRSARHLSDGVAEWRAAGLRIAEGREETQ